MVNSQAATMCREQILTRLMAGPNYSLREFRRDWSACLAKERLWPTEPRYIQCGRLPAFSRWLRGGHDLVLLGTTLRSFRWCHGNPGKSWRSERFVQPRDGYPHRGDLHIRVVGCTPHSSPADCKFRKAHMALPDFVRSCYRAFLALLLSSFATRRSFAGCSSR
jgi:hypothetical protein